MLTECVKVWQTVEAKFDSFFGYNVHTILYYDIFVYKYRKIPFAHFVYVFVFLLISHNEKSHGHQVMLIVRYSFSALNHYKL